MILYWPEEDEDEEEDEEEKKACQGVFHCEVENIVFYNDFE